MSISKCRSSYGVCSFDGIAKKQPYKITLITNTATMIRYNNIWKAKTVCSIIDRLIGA
jgi:hypothetical protein